jgi:hypothetical protein
MKTIKLKIKPTTAQAEAYDRLRADLSKVWNEIHRVAMHNRSVEWWKWAEKIAAKDGTWSLEDATLTNIKLPAKHAYVGAYCDVWYDGDRTPGWWAKDEKAEPIRYRGKKLSGKSAEKAKDIYWQDKTPCQAMYKWPMTKWVESGKPAIVSCEFQPIKLPSATGNGKEITKYQQLQNASHLRLYGIDLPAETSHFLAGLFAQFEESYKAWCDTKRPDAHKPRWRQIEQKFEWVRSLYSNQMRDSKRYGCTAAPIEFIRQPNGDYLGVNSIFGDLRLYDGEYDRIPPEMIPRSFSVTNDASGYYVSIVFASRAEVNSVLASAQLKRAGKDAPDEVKEPLRAAAKAARQSVVDENYSPGNGKILGCDPGVVRQLTAHDGVKTWHIKLAKQRQDKARKLDKRIEYLQSKLDRLKTANNIRLGRDKSHRRSAGELKIDGQVITLKNEVVLAKKVARLQLLRANRRRAYQHRVAVRLFAGGYSEIRWEKADNKKMMAKAEPQLNRSGKYQKNQAGAKRKLNRSLADSAMAAQAEKVKARFTISSRIFTDIAAPNTTQNCHCCGQKGDVGLDRIFHCLNIKCDLFQQAQDIDDNAAKNMWRGSVATDLKKIHRIAESDG